MPGLSGQSTVATNCVVALFTFCFTFLIAFIAGSTFFSVNDSSAESEQVKITTNINSVLAITTDAVNGELTLDITPTPSGTLDKKHLTVMVSTNNPTGYTLNMNSQTTNTTLVHESATGTPLAPNIPSTTHTYNTPAALAPDTWGWNLGTASSTSTFKKIPPSDDSQTIRTTSDPTSETDPSIANTLVTFGANVTNAMSAGNYINTIVFTATSNFVPPPEGNWAANDEAAKITTFDEYGVLTSTTGLIPIDYTNSTTYDATTTSTIGIANYNIIKGYLNSKQQIDIDDAYYLETPTTTDAQILNSLVAGDSVRIRGIGDVHEIVFRRRTASYALFEFNVPVNLYIQKIDFEVSKNTPPAKDSRIFGYKVEENWSTAFLMNDIILRDCSFKGPIIAVHIPATPPSGFSADRLSPSKHVINKVAFHNNTITDLAITQGIIYILDPYVKEFRVTNNTIRNSGWQIIRFLNDNVSNSDIDGSVAHNIPNRPSLFYIDENEFINDDGFDMFLAWKDVRETVSAPWGARPTWTSPTEYFSLIVHKGSPDVTFTNNHVEGLTTWGTANSPRIYTAYLSGQRVLYEDNFTKNVVVLSPNKYSSSIEGIEMFKFKENYGIDNSNRIVRNNTVIVEEDFPERILGTGTLASMPKSQVLEMLALRIAQNTGEWETFIFENNYIDIYSFMPYVNDLRNIQHQTFSHNTINAKYIISWTGNTGFSAFMAINPGTETTASITNVTGTIIGNTVNVEYANDAHPAGVGRNVALVVGTSILPSVVTVEDNTFNMGNLSYVFSDRRSAGGSHGTAELPNMTLKFNNNIVTTKPPGNINKKDVAAANPIVFSQFNNNTTSPGFSFIGSN